MTRVVIYILAARGAFDVAVYAYERALQFVHDLGPICASIGGGC